MDRALHQSKIVRMFHTSQWTENLIQSGLHLDPASPYFGVEFEVFIDNGGILYETVIPNARTNRIPVVPAFRMGDNQQVIGAGIDTSTWWDAHLLKLRTCLALIDSTRRICFDVENHGASTVEVMWEELTPLEQASRRAAAESFLSLIRSNWIVPLIHPCVARLNALAYLIFEAARGRGVAQLEETGDPKNIEIYAANAVSFSKRMLAQSYAARAWKRAFPNLLAANWASEEAFRGDLGRFSNELYSEDGLLWIMDFYRNHPARPGRDADEIGTLAHQQRSTANHQTPFYENMLASYVFAGKVRTSNAFQNLRNPESPLVATFGTNISPNGSWPKTLVTKRTGEFGPYAVNVKPMTEAIACTNAEVARGQPLSGGPFTFQLSIAIDPTRRDEQGRNAWERGGRLYSNWLNHPTGNLFRVEIENVDLDGVTGPGLRLHYVAGTDSTVETHSLLVPQEAREGYEPIDILVALSSSAVTLAMRWRLAAVSPDVPQITVATPDLPTLPVPSPPMTRKQALAFGDCLFCEFIGATIWKEYRRIFVVGTFPFYVAHAIP